MREYDVWFTNYQGIMYLGIGAPGEPPDKVTEISVSVAQVLQNIKRTNKINQVGIATPDMMGLIDIEI